MLRIEPTMGKLGSIKLVWRPMSGVVGYNIFRRILPNIEFTQIASNITNIIYFDNNVSPGILYSYCVKGVRSNGQQSVRSNIVTGQIAPFSSDVPTATALNNAKRIVFDNNSVVNLSFNNSEGIWRSYSNNFGTGWFTATMLDYGWMPTIGFNSNDRINISYIGTIGPDSAANETLTYTINYAHNLNDFWRYEVLYETHDSILSVSFTAEDW